MKEAIHIHTGKYYACKVINKKLMQGREHMVRGAHCTVITASLTPRMHRCATRSLS